MDKQDKIKKFRSLKDQSFLKEHQPKKQNNNLIYSACVSSFEVYFRDTEYTNRVDVALGDREIAETFRFDNMPEHIIPVEIVCSPSFKNITEKEEYIKKCFINILKAKLEMDIKALNLLVDNMKKDGEITDNFKNFVTEDMNSDTSGIIKKDR